MIQHYNLKIKRAHKVYNYKKKTFFTKMDTVSKGNLEKESIQFQKIHKHSTVLNTNDHFNGTFRLIKALNGTD